MKHSMVSRGLSLLTALALAVTLMTPAALADEEGGGENQPAANPTLTKVEFSIGTLAMKVDEVQTLTATVTMSDGSTTLPEGSVVNWEVIDDRTDEVSITPGGENSLSAEIKALAIPETTEDPQVRIQITVTPPEGYGQPQTAICDVTVSPSEPSGVVVVPATIELAPGGTRSVSATVNPPTAEQSVTWRSADEKVATVSATGDTSATVKAVSAGEAQVFARITEGTQEAYTTVTVQGIVLADESVTLNERGNRTLNYTVYGPSIQDKGVTWLSSDETVVKVTSGYLYAVQEGTATITAKVNGTTYEDTCTVTVKRNTAAVITASAGAGDPLSFSEILSDLKNRCTTVLGENLVYISGLSVPTDQGTLYYRYASEGDTGAGVAASSPYYVSPSTGQSGLSDITFVPKSDFSGTAEISYTGYTSGTSFFQGTIQVSVAAQQDVSYTTANGLPVQMDAYDFAVVCRARTGRDLSYVTFTLPDSSAGTLYYQYLSAQNPGTEVRTSTEYKYSGTPSLGEVYFVPASGYNGRVVITYTAWDTNRESFQGRLVIRVDASEQSGSLDYSVTPGSSVSFNVNDFNNLCRNLTGDSLNYVRFELPGSSQGILYYNYNSSSSQTVSSSRNYYRSSAPYLSQVSFVADKDYSGTVNIPFTGWSSGGITFSGSVTVRVGARSTSISYQTAYGREVTFQTGDFNSACQSATGSNLSYVRFTLPSASRGVLYYNYSGGSYDSKVTASKSYYRSSSPYLDEISFVPASGYTGTVSISYTGWSVDGERFTGTVSIQVGQETENIRYTTGEGESVSFQTADFNSCCQTTTGSSLNYVRFTLPTASRGTLYYNGNRVSSNQNYYRSSSPYLSQVSFTPASGYNGTVTISYTGWATNGDRYTGTVTIRVGNQGSGVTYDTKGREPAEFQVEDFNDISLSLTGSSLNYVRFTLPSSSQGILYYRYNNGSYDSRVTANKNYYRSSTPYLDDVSFVPASNFTGTCTISYTGWGTNGDRFTGTITILVGAQTSTIHYDTGLGEPVTFRPTDFNDAAQAIANRDVNYVRFTLPSSSQGTLYYKYDDGSYDSKVTASKSYYRSSSPYLDEVSFVPASGFTGTCSISYTGWTTSGTSFTGKVEIAVSNTTTDVAQTIRYNTSHAPITFQASDFTAACNSRGRGTLGYVLFQTETVPPTAGRLYHQYGGLQSANTEVRGTTVYYPNSSPSISQVTFVPHIGFQGTTTLSYTGVDSQGRTYRGAVEITVTPNTSSAYFNDMATGYAWAAAAVDFLYENDVVTGVGNGGFAPAAPLTRGSFITMLDRALNFPHTSQKNFPDVPAGQYYTEAVQSAYGLGIVTGFSDGTFRPNASISRAEAVTMLYRAMQTMGWSIGSENLSVLSSYSDGAYVADYAKGAMSVMIQAGIVQGNNGKLEPARIMTRAEMAVALARALTL